MRCSIQMPMLMIELSRQKDGLKSHWPEVARESCSNHCFGFLTFESCSEGHREDEHGTDCVDDAEIFDQQKTDDSSLDLAVSDIEHDADVGDHGDEEDDEDE